MHDLQVSAVVLLVWLLLLLSLGEWWHGVGGVRGKVWREVWVWAL